MYWIVCFSVTVFAVLLYWLYINDHVLNIIVSPTSTPPSHFILYLGGFPLVLLSFFACFFCVRTFSIHARDGIIEVFHAKPFSNIRYITSTTLALTFYLCLPIILFVFIVQSLGFANVKIGVVRVVPFEQVSTLVFLVFTTLVTVNISTVIYFFIYRYVRSVVSSMIACLTMFLFIMFVLNRVTMNNFIFFEHLPLVGEIASGMVVDRLSPFDVIRILGYAGFAGMLTGILALTFSRRDSHNVVSRVSVVVLSLQTFLCFSVLFYHWYTTNLEQRNWARSDVWHSEFVLFDVESIEGAIEIDPGEQINAQILLKGVKKESSARTVLLTLNPGFTVSAVKINDEDAEFEHDDGNLRLTVRPELRHNHELRVAVSYQGSPSVNFGYMDSAIDVRSVRFSEQLISYYGTSNGIFDPAYVALPQGVRWLPMSPNTIRHGAGHKDFFSFDLTVSLPNGWTVATVGSRRSMNTGNELAKNTFNLQSTFLTSRLDLFAAEFVVLASDLPGSNIQLELLTPYKLIQQFSDDEHLDGYRRAFEERMTKFVTRAHWSTSSFPCKTYRFIAVPSPLRTFVGGIFMDSILSSPCILLLREHGLLATKFGSTLSNFPTLDDETMHELFYSSDVRDYFFRGFNEGDFWMELGNHKLDYLVGVKGPNSEYLMKVLSYLNDLTWLKRVDTYSVSAFFPRAMKMSGFFPYPDDHWSPDGHSLMLRWIYLHIGKRFFRHLDTAPLISQFFFESFDVLQLAMNHSLAELSSMEHSPLVQQAIRLRCATVARKIYFVLGHDKSEKLIQDIVRHFKYENVSVTELYDMSAQLGVPLRELMGGWFDARDSYNLSFSDVSSTRFTDDNKEELQYQLSFHVANQSQVPSVFRTSIFVDPRMLTPESALHTVGVQSEYSELDVINGPTFYVPAMATVEVGLVTTGRPLRIELEHYAAALTDFDSFWVKEEHNVVLDGSFKPLIGTRLSDWTPVPLDGIVIDDLQLNVAVNEAFMTNFERRIERFDFGGAWGKSRKTFVYTERIKPRFISMEVELPNEAKWQIYFHVPDTRGQLFIGRGANRDSWGRVGFDRSFDGSYQLKFVSQTGDKLIEFEVVESDHGWIQLGSVQLEEGLTEIVLSPNGQDQYRLFFDALRMHDVED